MGDDNPVAAVEAPKEPPISVTLQQFIEKAHDLFLKLRKDKRFTLRWVNDLRDGICKCGDFERLDDGQLKPKDPAINTWIAPFNEFVLYEAKLSDEEDEAVNKEFRQKFLRIVLELAEGEWLTHCGLPKSNGLMIHIANAAQFKGNPISAIRTKFRNTFYGKVGDEHADLTQVEQENYFAIFKRAAENADLPENKDDLKLQKDAWVVIGRHLKELGTTDGCSVKRKGRWRNEKRGRSVTVYNVVTPNRTFVFKNSHRIYREHRRLEIFINTVHAAKQYTAEQENRALEKLHDMVTQEQYDQYTITGVLREKSEKSGVVYFVRKLKPTLAFRERELSIDLLAGLCLHPMAYYLDSFAGCLCPTDDVISHLLWIRGDERRYWSKANQHPQEQVEIGLP